MRNRNSTTMGEKLIKSIIALQMIATLVLCLSIGTLVYLGINKVIDNGGVENTIVLVGKSIKNIGERISEDEDQKPVTVD